MDADGLRRWPTAGSFLRIPQRPGRPFVCCVSEIRIRRFRLFGAGRPTADESCELNGPTKHQLEMKTSPSRGLRRCMLQQQIQFAVEPEFQNQARCSLLSIEIACEILEASVDGDGCDGS